MMQEAPAVMASSRNILSLGSRQALIEMLTSKAMVSRSSFCITCSLLSSVKYLSNFLRKSTSVNSAKVAAETMTFPV